MNHNFDSNAMHIIIELGSAALYPHMYDSHCVFHSPSRDRLCQCRLARSTAHTHHWHSLLAIGARASRILATPRGHARC